MRQKDRRDRRWAIHSLCHIDQSFAPRFSRSILKASHAKENKNKQNSKQQGSGLADPVQVPSCCGCSSEWLAPVRTALGLLNALAQRCLDLCHAHPPSCPAPRGALVAVQFPLQSSQRLTSPETTFLPGPCLPSLLSPIPFLVSPKSTVSISDIYTNLSQVLLPGGPV